MRAEKIMVDLTCSYCKKDFVRQKCYTKKNSSRHYCSISCHMAAKREKIEISKQPCKKNPNFVYKNGKAFTTIKCDRCEIEIERRIDQVNQRGTGNYCRTCSNKMTAERMIGNTINPKTGGMLTCKNCSKEFYYVKSKLHTRKYCSAKCMHDWQSRYEDKSKFIKNKLAGENHPCYKHGRRVGKHVNKPKLRKQIIDRDGGNWCLLCGKPGPGLHVHRVIYGSHGGKYELGNCVLLCGEDHARVHASKITWAQRLLSYLSEPVRNKHMWLKQSS